MRQRGRASIASTSVVAPDFGTKRPDPPPELSERQREIWVETCAAEPAGFFTPGAVLGMLADYCAHREVAEKMTDMIDAFEPEWLTNKDGLTRYHSLLKMRELETRGAAHLATKLRLTNQSRYRPEKPDRLPGQGKTARCRGKILKHWRSPMSLQVVDGPTIPLNELLSDGVDCSAGTIVRITVPQEFTEANLTFQTSSDGNLYNDLCDDKGEEITVVAKPDTTIVVHGPWVRSIGFIKLRSGTREHPVEQTRDEVKFAVAIEVAADAPAATGASKSR